MSRDFITALKVVAILIVTSFFFGCPTNSLRKSEVRPIGPDVEAHLLIYFRNPVTREQINTFSKDVLSRPHPSGRGDALPVGVETFLRIYPPVQGHEGIAIRFDPKASEVQRRTLLNSIKATPIVYRVLENRAPNSVKSLEP